MFEGVPPRMAYCSHEEHWDGILLQKELQDSSQHLLSEDGLLLETQVSGCKGGQGEELEGSGRSLKKIGRSFREVVGAKEKWEGLN